MVWLTAMADLCGSRCGPRGPLPDRGARGAHTPAQTNRCRRPDARRHRLHSRYAARLPSRMSPGRDLRERRHLRSDVHRSESRVHGGLSRTPPSREGHAAPHGTRAGFLAGCRDEEFCPRNDSGESCLSVARLYARDWKRAVRHSGPEPAMAPELMDAVLRLYVSGYSHRQIARAGDIGKSTVGRYLQLARAGQYCPMPHQIIAGFRRAVASLS